MAVSIPAGFFGVLIGILDSLSGIEFFVIALFAFLVLGPDKLPDAMRKVGRAVGEVRKVTSGFQEEVKAAMTEAEVAARLPDGFSDLRDSSSPDDASDGGSPDPGASTAPDAGAADAASSEADETS